MIQRYQQGGVEVYQLSERLTVDEVELSRQLVVDTIPQRVPQLVLDMRKVRVIDSAGLELLCDIQTQCSQRGGTLHLAAVGGLVAEVLRLTGLDDEFSQYQDVIAAAGALSL